MRIKKPAQAGRRDTSDLLVEVEPIEGNGIEIVLESSVKRLFGERIKEVAEGTIKRLGYEGVRCKIIDDGALDYVIQARIEAALMRATED